MSGGLPSRFRERAAESVPLPGAGDTLGRWRFLAEVAAEDLALAKLVESHFDAIAILHELRAGDLVEPGQHWAVWAAEPPDARLRWSNSGRLNGTKAWCSGAAEVTHGLVTAWTDSGEQQLVAVDLRSARRLPGAVEDVLGAWQAVGMGRVATPDLVLVDVPGTAVGRPGDYTGRPGFWHGGAGIAACWFGGTLPLAQAVRHARPEPHRAAHLGAIDVEVRLLRALLVELATAIDRDPQQDRAADALRVRAAADATARRVLDRAGRALGAGPLCRDQSVAQHFADLPVFIRQTHAERDLAALAELIGREDGRWNL